MTKHKTRKPPAKKNFLRVEMWDSTGTKITYENDIVSASIKETPNPAVPFVVKLVILAQAKQNGKTSPAERWMADGKPALDEISYGCGRAS